MADIRLPQLSPQDVTYLWQKIALKPLQDMLQTFSIEVLLETDTRIQNRGLILCTDHSGDILMNTVFKAQTEVFIVTSEIDQTFTDDIKTLLVSTIPSMVDNIVIQYSQYVGIQTEDSIEELTAIISDIVETNTTMSRLNTVKNELVLAPELNAIIWSGIYHGPCAFDDIPQSHIPVSFQAAAIISNITQIILADQDVQNTIKAWATTFDLQIKDLVDFATSSSMTAPPPEIIQSQLLHRTITYSLIGTGVLGFVLLAPGVYYEQNTMTIVAAIILGLTIIMSGWVFLNFPPFDYKYPELKTDATNDITKAQYYELYNKVYQNVTLPLLEKKKSIPDSDSDSDPDPGLVDFDTVLLIVQNMSDLSKLQEYIQIIEEFRSSCGSCSGGGGGGGGEYTSWLNLRQKMRGVYRPPRCGYHTCSDYNM